MATPTNTPRRVDRAAKVQVSIAMPCVLLGVGLGGLFDGIVFHQILQWHHMLSSMQDHPVTTVPGLEANTLWDGLFHAATYVLIAIGLFMLWSRGRRGGVVWSWRSLLGWSLLGWGLFDVVEGTVNHHILGIHHVRPGPDQLAYDLGFLALGVLLVIVGSLVALMDKPSERAIDAPTQTGDRLGPRSTSSRARMTRATHPGGPPQEGIGSPTE
jgi:uncharacterized membrane protein